MHVRPHARTQVTCVPYMFPYMSTWLVLHIHVYMDISTLTPVGRPVAPTSAVSTTRPDIHIHVPECPQGPNPTRKFCLLEHIARSACAHQAVIDVDEVKMKYVSLPTTPVL